MKEIRLKITPEKNGAYNVKVNKTEFVLLRTGDGENEYLEVFPHNFPFRTIKLKTGTVQMDLLETLVLQELVSYTSEFIDL